MPELKREIIKTDDGSTSIYIPELDENYHSKNGAIQESTHVFINAGLNHVNGKRVKIFEMGFGTGLNCLLTYFNAGDKSIEYHTLEKYALKPGEIQQLNYAHELQLIDKNKLAWNKMHEINWNSEVKLSKTFALKKILGDILEYELPDKYDLIYFDAFAPEIQPNLWTVDIFRKLHTSMNTGGILTTYCAKGQVRRNMEVCGFKVERLPGPPGKRQIIRAYKT